MRDVRDSDCEVEYSEAKHVQAAAALEQYIALDRPDIAYSVKSALQRMSKLMQLRVVRVGRYLKNNPRLVWKFPYQVLARRPGVNVNQLMPPWVTRLWLGRDTLSDEHLIGTAAGVMRSRAVRRLQEPVHVFNKTQSIVFTQRSGASLRGASFEQNTCGWTQ